jgi:surfactin synthase thioesterase subunit
MPQSRNWPVAFCGHSGGAKRSCLLGAMMAQAHAVNICGFFLSGINDDKMSESYKTYQPGRDFLNIPVWISGGNEDPIATPGLEGQMMANMRRTGFTRVRLEHFPGVHQMRRSELKLALRWFRELGGF